MVLSPLPEFGDTGQWSFKGLLLLHGISRGLLASVALENGSVGVAGPLAREWAQVSNSRICHSGQAPFPTKPASHGHGVTWASPTPSTGLLLSPPSGSGRVFMTECPALRSSHGACRECSMTKAPQRQQPHPYGPSVLVPGTGPHLPLI